MATATQERKQAKALPPPNSALDLSGGRIFSLNPDGSDPKTLVTECRLR